MEGNILKKEITLPKLSEKTKNIIRDVMFLAALVLMTAGGMLRNTMCDFGGNARYELQLWAKVIIIAKLIIFDHKNKLVWAIGVPALILGKLIYHYYSFDEAMSLAAVAVGAVGVRYDKIAKTYFITAGALLSAIMIASLTGAIPDLVYTNTGHDFLMFNVRHSFGIQYPTDFAAYVFFILTGFYIAFDRNKKLTVPKGIIGLIITIVVYLFCLARLDCGCMFILTVGMIAVRAFDKHFGEEPKGAANVIKKIYEQVCIWSMPILATLFIGLTLMYRPDSPFLSKLDRLLSGRLALGSTGFKNHDVHLMGRYFSMSGYGGSTDIKAANELYDFLDSSYVNCLLRYGLIFMIVVAAAFVFIGFKYKKNHLVLLCSAAIALNCMVAHHLPDVSYNFFIAMLAAEGGTPLKELFGRKKSKQEQEQPAESS